MTERQLLLKNIRVRRAELDLTQLEASTRAGFTYPSVWSDIENGKQSPNLTTLEKIAMALDTSIKNLFKERVEA